MTECESYGMGNGCDIDCPVLLAHECELQDDENKKLYIEALRQHFDIHVYEPMTEDESFLYRIGIDE